MLMHEETALTDINLMTWFCFSQDRDCFDTGCRTCHSSYTFLVHYKALRRMIQNHQVQLDATSPITENVTRYLLAKPCCLLQHDHFVRVSGYASARGMSGSLTVAVCWWLQTQAVITVYALYSVQP